MGGLEQCFPVPYKNLSLDIKIALEMSTFSTVYLVLGRKQHRYCHLPVMATQIGTMGTILHARKAEGVTVQPTFDVSVIFGKRDEPMLLAISRQLIKHISSSGSFMPLVLSLGLKNHSAETLKGIVSAVIENRLW